MVGWHHLLSGHEFEHALGVGDGQGSLFYTIWDASNNHESNFETSEPDLHFPTYCVIN